MKKEKHVVISKGNIKMGQIQSVSLPPIVTCSPLACKFCSYYKETHKSEVENANSEKTE